jgi:hypothetical protein
VCEIPSQKVILQFFNEPTSGTGSGADNHTKGGTSSGSSGRRPSGDGQAGISASSSSPNSAAADWCLPSFPNPGGNNPGGMHSAQQTAQQAGALKNTMEFFRVEEVAIDPENAHSKTMISPLSPRDTRDTDNSNMSQLTGDRASNNNMSTADNKSSISAKKSALVVTKLHEIPLFGGRGFSLNNCAFLQEEVHADVEASKQSRKLNLNSGSKRSDADKSTQSRTSSMNQNSQSRPGSSTNQNNHSQSGPNSQNSSNGPPGAGQNRQNPNLATSEPKSATVISPTTAVQRAKKSVQIQVTCCDSFTGGCIVVGSNVGQIQIILRPLEEPAIVRYHKACGIY